MSQSEHEFDTEHKTPRAERTWRPKSRAEEAPPVVLTQQQLAEKKAKKAMKDKQVPRYNPADQQGRRSRRSSQTSEQAGPSRQEKDPFREHQEQEETDQHESQEEMDVDGARPETPTPAAPSAPPPPINSSGN
ncbi:hypothetical protein FRC03_012173 [Tulasnella sp. 419]|nr:hypothetical protein FRC03_012173 [Tulasnella sp. 419]